MHDRVSEDAGIQAIGLVPQAFARLPASGLCRLIFGAFGVMAMVTALAISPTNDAHAQSFERPDPEQPVSLVADTVTADSEAGIVTAEGSVEVYYGERTLTAQKIVYNERTGRIAAEGNLVLRDPSGVTVFAEAADLDEDLRDGLVRGARSVLGEHTRLAAVEGRRIDQRYNTLSKAVYSPCKVCPEDPTPLWRIRARKIIHDEEERMIHYENATFDVLGVSIAWLPYFRHPDPSVKRASGFLVPSFLSSSTFGYAVKTPFFWAINGQSDLTVTPFFTTNDGLILESEYRHVFDSGGFSFGGSITVNDYEGPTKPHGHVDTEGLFDIGSGLDLGWDITLASDDAYLSRFELDTSDRLTSELFVKSYARDGFVDVSGVYFQSLRDNEPAGNIPLVLPVMDARYELNDPWAGGMFGLFTSAQALLRDNGRDMARLSIGADWERQEITSWGLSLTGFAEVRGDLFSVQDDPAVTDDFTARLAGHAGIEARFPLVSEPVGGVTHMVEPVIQAIIAPYGGNSARIPVEDSLVTEFDETNVIDRNHFSGIDAFEEGPRINVALRYDRIVDDGLRFDASVGRVYRFRQNNAFSAGSGLRDAESDFVMAWGADYDPYLSVRHRMRFSEDATITRNEFFGSLNIEPVELNAGYVFLESDQQVGALTDREEINTSALINIDDNWSVSAFMQRDFQLGEFVQIGGALAYENECCAVELFLRRRFTDQQDSPASTSVGVQIRLLTLGDSDDR